MFSLLLAMVTAPALAQSTNSAASTSTDYSSFSVISGKNIFNPRRNYTQYSRPGPTTPRIQAPRAENFALLGTMIYEKGPVAFFDGSSFGYRKATAPSETIAGFTVNEIQPDYVKLVSASNRFELHVGMELRKDAEGVWRMGEAAQSSEGYERRPVASTQASTSATDSGTPPQEGDTSSAAVDPDTGLPIDNPPDSTMAPAQDNSAPAAGGGSDILTRLRQRRQQEDNR